MINGILNVYKEKDFTSFDVVAKLRGIVKQKKIGHTGTLDPDAVGVLPVCLGSATKLCDMLTDKTKEYVAEFLLGKTTDTQDITGTVLTQSKVTCSEMEVSDTIKNFEGTINQIPPMYSAIKVNGKKLYELARQGKEIERKAREITIYGIDILDIQIPKVKIRVKCSKGTYIRTLCHDIGAKLSCGAVMTSLERTESGIFKKQDALTLSQIEMLWNHGELERHVIPVDAIFGTIPALYVRNQLLHKVENGNTITNDEIEKEADFDSQQEKKKYLNTQVEGTRYRIYGEIDGRHCFLAIYEYSEEKNGIKPFKMFLEQKGL